MSEDGYTRITLRIPDQLHAQLTEAAASTSKSMNAEIVGRLGDSFSGPRATLKLNPVSMALVIRSRLAALNEIIAATEAEAKSPAIDPEFAAAIRAEISSLNDFAATLRQALVHVVKARRTDAPIPEETKKLVAELARLNF